MNNVELSEKVRTYLKGSESRAAKFEDLVAVSISLLSEDTEDMYVAVRDGEILVAPYPYNDNNCSVEATPDTIDKLFAGEMAFETALNDGYVSVKSGDPAKFKALEVLVDKKEAKTENTESEQESVVDTQEETEEEPVANTQEETEEEPVADTQEETEEEPAADTQENTQAEPERVKVVSVPPERPQHNNKNNKKNKKKKR